MWFRAAPHFPGHATPNGRQQRATIGSTWHAPEDPE
jgi:hypothetical protein